MSTALRTLGDVARAITAGADPTEAMTEYHSQRPDDLLASDYSGIARGVALAEEHGRAGLVGPLRQHLNVVAAEQEKRKARNQQPETSTTAT